MTKPLAVRSPVSEWCGNVGGLTDSQYKARLRSAITETSGALSTADGEYRAEVLADQAELVSEWLKLDEAGVR